MSTTPPVRSMSGVPGDPRAAQPSVPAVPDLVTMDLWGVPARSIPAALGRMGLDRRPVRTAPGVTFAKLLGTGAGQTYTPRDADLRHWGLLVCWSERARAEAFSTSRTATSWAGLAEEHLHVRLNPLTAKGRWSGREPFGSPTRRPTPGQPVAAITRARLSWRHTRAFWQASPPVSVELNASPGLLMATGIGEAPIGLQGTFSLWRDAAALAEFAYRSPRHAEVIRRTPQVGWYVEELFARFAVESATGTFAGRTIRAGTPA